MRDFDATGIRTSRVGWIQNGWRDASVGHRQHRHLLIIERVRCLRLTAGWLPSAVPSPQPPRPGPRLRRGRSKARAPMARKPCLLASVGEGLDARALSVKCTSASGRMHMCFCSRPRTLFIRSGCTDAFGAPASESVTAGCAATVTHCFSQQWVTPCDA
ncbi:hypothetical protein XdyCFBP7245_14150 [Xanthomonas dyei]|uniref:Uncharacterized protein n=1 Tax=Xanthomonas dyei TaxID=743699 RepID=A0A2S7C0X6_9XANT|nr:hypothetical protein XdyCFBP7245_14150 [Xanthomonas dyei]